VSVQAWALEWILELALESVPVWALESALSLFNHFTNQLEALAPLDYNDKMKVLSGVTMMHNHNH
jgi:hypothetical protein